MVRLIQLAAGGPGRSVIGPREGPGARGAAAIMGQLAGGAAGVRAGREVTRGHHAQARRVCADRWPGGGERYGGRGSVHGQLHLLSTSLVQGADVANAARRPAPGQRGAGAAAQCSCTRAYLIGGGAGIEGGPRTGKTIGCRPSHPGVSTPRLTDGGPGRRLGSYNRARRFRGCSTRCARRAAGRRHGWHTAADTRAGGHRHDMAILVVRPPRPNRLDDARSRPNRS